jgi:hypothetical protein
LCSAQGLVSGHFGSGHFFSHLFSHPPHFLSQQPWLLCEQPLPVATISALPPTKAAKAIALIPFKASLLSFIYLSFLY